MCLNSYGIPACWHILIDNILERGIIYYVVKHITSTPILSYGASLCLKRRSDLFWLSEVGSRECRRHWISPILAILYTS